MAVSAGSRVTARGLVWDVVAVEPVGRQQLLRLRCAAGDLRGLDWEMLTPHEAVAPLQAALQPQATRSFETWRLHHIACLLDQVPGPTALLAGVPGRVAIEPYQLVPLLRALAMPRPRLLLADGVGLGKTIQAGLIATELIARRRAHRILVVTPAGPLLRQWDQELRQRFGLRFTTIADAGALQAERRRLELGGNPFDATALCLTALDFAKQERVLEALERSAWDLVIIDEAHHCIGAGDDRDTTQRRRLAEVLAGRSDGLLLLTATPHDGSDAHFGSLLALLDPSLTDATGLPAGTAYRRHVVRRLKQHIRDPAGQPLFRARRMIPVAVAVPPGAGLVRAFHAALSALVAPRLGRAGGESLAFVSLLKRSVSTLAACVATLRVVAERYGHTDPAEARERTRALRAYRRRLARYGVLEAMDEAEAAELEAEDVAARLRNDEAAALLDLIRLGEQAAPRDPKLAALLAEIRAIRAGRPRANVLVYTEYADSQAAALAALRGAGLSGEILGISGQDDDAARSRAAERCASADDVILVSTDSLAEGLNLHQRCCHLVHLDLPYNPNRLEQRNGRIDRYGQREEPQIRYLYLAGTFEERLLLRLIGKYEQARATLTFMPDTLGVTADPADWAPALLEGFAERQAQLFEDAPPAIRSLDHTGEALDADAYRALLQEIDRAYDGFERMALRHGWLAGQGMQAEAALLTEADRAHRRRAKLLGRLDLGAFVRDALAIETGTPPRQRMLHVPPAWTVGLDGLPGYDVARRTLPIGGMGRAHPLVRRAIDRMRQAEPVASALRGDADGPALLLTYAAELFGPQGLAWQRVLAVRLPRSGPPEVVPDPQHWLPAASAATPPNAASPIVPAPNVATRPNAASPIVPTPNVATRPNAASPIVPAPNVTTPPNGPSPIVMAGPVPAIPTGTAKAERAPAPRPTTIGGPSALPADLWRRRFAAWATARLPDAEAAATALAVRLAATFRADRQARIAQEAADLADWMRRRTNALCGPAEPRTQDLFATAEPALDWRFEPAPDCRLPLYAADPATSPADRAAASDLLALAQARRRDQADRLALGPPILRPLGLLMLVPDA